MRILETIIQYVIRIPYFFSIEKTTNLCFPFCFAIPIHIENIRIPGLVLQEFNSFRE